MVESDRNKDDGLQLAVDGVTGGNYLGDPTVVEQLVRDFMTGIFSARAAWHADSDGKAAEDRIDHLCKQYGGIFMGESHAHVPMAWNSPHRLGSFIRATVADHADFGSPGEAYFHFLALQALQASIALEQETMGEQEVQAELTTVVQDAVEVLLGRRAGGNA